MSIRCIDVMHLLAARLVNGRHKFLFYPHDKWFAPDSGEPFLAFPAKTIVTGQNTSSPSGRSLKRALLAILREDLGGLVKPVPSQRRLPPAMLAMISPTKGIPTTYTIWPVLLPVNRCQAVSLQSRLHGEWLSREEALRNSLTSPTARCLLERAAPLALEPALPEDRPCLPCAAERPKRDAWTERLLGAYRGGSRTFGSLFEEMKPWLTHRLMACDNTNALFLVPDDVEDALHDAALNALTHLDRFDPQLGTAGTWLWAIARNCAITILRRRTRRATSPLTENGGTYIKVADNRYDPAVQAERNEELALVRRRLERVFANAHPKLRKAWDLRFVEGRRYAEIAAELGEPVGTIATWIYRLKKAARGQLP